MIKYAFGVHFSCDIFFFLRYSNPGVSVITLKAAWLEKPVICQCICKNVSVRAAQAWGVVLIHIHDFIFIIVCVLHSMLWVQKFTINEPWHQWLLQYIVKLLLVYVFSVFSACCILLLWLTVQLWVRIHFVKRISSHISLWSLASSAK